MKAMRAKWFVLAGVCLLLIALLWVGPVLRKSRGRTAGVGTSGVHEQIPSVDIDPTTIRELEQIAGLSNADDLVGHRVDLHVKVPDINNYGVFWIGEANHLVPVVLNRDNRTDAQRDSGTASPNDIKPVEAGSMAHIVGTIQKVPAGEARFSWGRADPQHQGSNNIQVYIRADSITPDAR